jgi:hypothetical protein
MRKVYSLESRKTGLATIAILIMFILVALAATGCTGDASGTPGTTASPNATGPTQPGTFSAQEPIITLTPERGTGGASITVTGEHFPQWSRVEIHLGGLDTEATRQAYAATTADGTGAIDVDFELPDHWPNGDPIVQPQVVVVAATPDFVSKATAIFANDTNLTPSAP